MYLPLNIVSFYLHNFTALGFDPSDLVPALFRGTAINETAVQLTWVPDDGSCDLFGYNINVYEGQVFQYTRFVEGGETSAYTVGGLRKGTIYTFQINPDSFSFDGIVGSDSVQVQTLGKIL